MVIVKKFNFKIGFLEVTTASNTKHTSQVGGTKAGLPIFNDFCTVYGVAENLKQLALLLTQVSVP